MQEREGESPTYEDTTVSTTTASSSGAGRSDDHDDDSEQRPKRARRTFLTQNACQRCRRKKSKCDGKRPICGRCEKNGADCKYDVAREGLTRMQNLQQQLTTRTADYTRLRSLFTALEQGTDQEATTLLARLRMGAGIEDLLDVDGNVQGSSRMVDGGPSEDTSSTTSSVPQSQPNEFTFQQQQQQQSTGYMQGWPRTGMVDGTDQIAWGQASSDRRMSHPSDYFEDTRFQVTQLHFPGLIQEGHDNEYHRMTGGLSGQQGQEGSAVMGTTWYEQAEFMPADPPAPQQMQRYTESRPFHPSQSSSDVSPRDATTPRNQDASPNR